MGAVAKKKNAELSTDVMDDILSLLARARPLTVAKCRYRLFVSCKPCPRNSRSVKLSTFEGSEQGDMFNNVTMELVHGEEGSTDPALLSRLPSIWSSSREQGGGFQGEIPCTDPVLATNHASWVQGNLA